MCGGQESYRKNPSEDCLFFRNNWILFSYHDLQSNKRLDGDGEVSTEPVTNGASAWNSILGTGNGKTHFLGRCGTIPVYDGTSWVLVRNVHTIYEGAENCTDPAKADTLRVYANSLLDHYPETIQQLEKLGVRVKALLNRQIKTYEDVVTWAESIFNTGPTLKLPPHVADTVALAFNDVIIEVKAGKDPAYVIPAAPRGADVMATLDFMVPGSKTRYGPRHEFTRTAFSKQLPDRTRYQGDAPRRRRGRPRKDGLMPGSDEAKLADKQKADDRKARREAREAARLESRGASKSPPKPAPLEEKAASGNGKAEASDQVASITPMPSRRRRPLVKVGQDRRGIGT